MLLTSFLKISEDKQKLIVLFFLIFILLFVIFGYIGILVKKVMKSQSERADALIHDVVIAEIFKDEKKLNAFGIRKNWRMFYKQSWIPFLVMLSSALVTMVFCFITNLTFTEIWSFEKGYMSIFYQFDFKNIETTRVFFFKHVPSWIPVLHEPTFITSNIVLYISITAFFVGFVWFMVCAQAYIARAVKLRKIAKKVFKKSLDDFKPTETNQSPINPE